KIHEVQITIRVDLAVVETDFEMNAVVGISAVLSRSKQPAINMNNSLPSYGAALQYDHVLIIRQHEPTSDVALGRRVRAAMIGWIQPNLPFYGSQIGSWQPRHRLQSDGRSSVP